MGTFDTAFLVASVIATVPLLLAASGELLSERSGVLNVGLEGMMIVGAFFGFAGAEQFDSWLAGCLAGAMAGLVFAALSAFLAVQLRADQIVVGIGLNLLGLSLTAFLYNEWYVSYSRVLLDRPPHIAIPGLSSLPVVGEAFFDQQALVYLTGFAFAAIWFVVARTGWGINIRAAGEAPAAADSAGVSIARTRWAAACTAGALAGIGGAYLSVFQVGSFTPGMSAGRGFLALAAVIFGRWRPFGVLCATAIFGAATALQYRLQAQSSIGREIWVALGLLGAAFVVTAVRGARARGRPALSGRSVVAVAIPMSIVLVAFVCAVVEPTVSFPPQVWLGLPYALSLIALAGFVGHARMPSALAVPFSRSAATA